MGYQPIKEKVSDVVPAIVGIVLIIIITYIAIGVDTKCPACNKWFARQSYDREFLNSREREVHDIITHYNYDQNGNIIGTWFEYDDYIRVTETYRYYNTCKYCKVKWEDIREESHRRHL